MARRAAALNYKGILMKPLVHARNSVRRYGGRVEDYLPIHDWFDSTKAAYADFAHRAILHHSFGIYLAEQLFGTAITNSDGAQICVRSIAEDHVSEDCGGRIPTIQDWLQSLQPEPWMLGVGQREFARRMNLEAD
jgi:hypothetical protein